MTEPFGSALPQSASAATSSTQRIDTSTGDQAQPRTDLNSQQAAIEIGGSVPVVFCRRVDGMGGVWLNPPAVEARLENDLENRVTVWYRLILSDGQTGPVASPDVYQGDRQRGSVVFAYNARPGTWTPGNFLQQRWDTVQYHTEEEISSGPDQQLEITLRSRGNNVTYYRVDHTNVSPGAPLTQLPDYTASAQVTLGEGIVEHTFLETGDLAGKSGGQLTQYFKQEIWETDRPPLRLPAAFAYCGDGTGSFEGVSSLSYTETFRPEMEEDYHKLQVHVFMREGLHVERLLDDYSVGPSDLFPDLAMYLLQSRLPLQLVDYEILQEAALFCERQGFKYNGVLSSPTNIRDFLNRVAPLNMLTVVQREGNIGLRPVVPYNEDGEIYVGPSLPRCLFDETTIAEGSFRLTYVPISQRSPIVAEVLWRQQPEGNVGLIRATQIKYADTPADAPVEQYDLSDFCTDHVHAVKVGTSILSRRRHITHTASVTCLPGGFAGALIPGDVVEVALGRDSSLDGAAGAAEHHFFYQVNSVATDRQGSVDLELTHWPVDEDGASLVALDIANVDPGAVSLNDNGLPQPVDPVDALFSETLADNYFITLTFLPVEVINNAWRICVQASAPIQNGDLVLTLNVGYQIVIEEGETLGCVDVPITGDILDELINLDDVDLGLDDLIIPSLNDLSACVDEAQAVLGGTVSISDLPPEDLLCIITAIIQLNDLLDLGLDLGDLTDLTLEELEGLTLEELGNLDLGDLADLTLDGLELLLDELTIDDLLIDLGDLDIIDIGEIDGEIALELDIPGIFIPIENVTVDPISIEGIDAPAGYEVPTIDIGGIDTGGIGVDGISIGAINIGGFSLDLDLEDLEVDAEGCVGPSVGLYFSSASFEGNTLVLKLRISPTGVAPKASLGALQATVTSTETVAYTTGTNTPVSPQPSGLPTYNFTAPIAFPWSEPGPVPYDRIFQGEFRIEYPDSAWPQESGIEYRMALAVQSTSGGFCNVTPTNTALAIFNGRTPISWSTSQNGIIAGGGWVISNSGNTIRFNIEDSANCGGSNSNTQSGTATASITVTGASKSMTVSLSGVGERESSAFELMTLKLNGTVIVQANAPGGSQGCAMGPVNISTLVTGPYTLAAGQHTFVLEFTTADALYHVGAYYLCQLSFT